MPVLNFVSLKFLTKARYLHNSRLNLDKFKLLKVCSKEDFEIRDIYIEKDASINEEIDRLRLASTSALVSRRDCIIVASVSCIYGLGSPEEYKRSVVPIRVGETAKELSVRSSASGQLGSW